MGRYTTGLHYSAGCCVNVFYPKYRTRFALADQLVSSFVALSLELFQSLHDLSARFYVFDALLFSLGMLVFTVADPIFANLDGYGFSRVDESFYSGNSVGNMAGLVITVFCLCFYLGRVLVRTSCTREPRSDGSYNGAQDYDTSNLMLGTLISLLAFLMNGGGFGLET